MSVCACVGLCWHYFWVIDSCRKSCFVRNIVDKYLVYLEPLIWPLCKAWNLIHTHTGGRIPQHTHGAARRRWEFSRWKQCGFWKRKRQLQAARRLPQGCYKTSKVWCGKPNETRPNNKPYTYTYTYTYIYIDDIGRWSSLHSWGFTYPCLDSHYGTNDYNPWTIVWPWQLRTGTIGTTIGT